MKYFYALLLPILFVSATSFAQSFKDAYAITQKGDTLRGFIEHSGLEHNPHIVKFKPTGIAEVQKFPISEIRSFAFTGLEKYERHVVNISLDETHQNRLGHGRDTTFKTDTVFLQVLESGKYVKLYAYTDDIKARYYTSDATNSIPTELIFKVYFSAGESSGNSNAKSEVSYKKQLSALALKNNKLTTDIKRTIDKAEYSQTAMLEVVGKINDTPKAETAKKTSSPIGILGIAAVVAFVIIVIVI
nr:hypothetical protein [uncultured Mucilaginibacter sp.]